MLSVNAIGQLGGFCELIFHTGGGHLGLSWSSESSRLVVAIGAYLEGQAVKAKEDRESRQPT